MLDLTVGPESARFGQLSLLISSAQCAMSNGGSGATICTQRECEWFESLEGALVFIFGSIFRKQTNRSSSDVLMAGRIKPSAFIPDRRV